MTFLCFGNVHAGNVDSIYESSEKTKKESQQPRSLLPSKEVEIPPVEIIAASNADERLFLLYLLKKMYWSFPSPDSQHQDIQNQISELRHRANRHHEDIKERNLDGTIAGLYEDFLAALDSYSAFLSKVGEIQNNAVARVEKESAESGFSAGYAGGSYAYKANSNGASGIDSIIGGAAVGLMSYLWDDYNKGKARDAAKQMALESTAQEFQKNLSTYIARAQNACLNLEEKYSWKRGEVGFDTRNDAPELLKIRFFRKKCAYRGERG